MAINDKYKTLKALTSELTLLEKDLAAAEGVAKAEQQALLTKQAADRYAADLRAKADKMLAEVTASMDQHTKHRAEMGAITQALADKEAALAARESTIASKESKLARELEAQTKALAEQKAALDKRHASLQATDAKLTAQAQALTAQAERIRHATAGL